MFKKKKSKQKAAAAAAAAGAKRQRDGNFTDEPEDGWLHDDDALAIGEGLFYSFPVEYVGNRVLERSLRDLPLEDTTDLLRELIATVCEECGVREPEKRKVPKHFAPYLTGVVTNARVSISLCMSSDGMAIAPPSEMQKTSGPNSELDGVLFFHKMRGISVATGGTLRDYEMVAYVARDDTDLRQLHVFDCRELADEVLATLGQSFNLAQQIALRERSRPQQIKIEYDAALPSGYLDVGVEYDEASSLGYLDPVSPYADIDGPEYAQADKGAAPACDPPEYATADSIQGGGSSSHELVGGAPTYDTATGHVISEPTYDNADGATGVSREDVVLDPVYDVAGAAKVIGILNKKDSFKRSMRKSRKGGKGVKPMPAIDEPSPSDLDSLSLAEASTSKHARPSWLFISPTSGTLDKRIKLEDLKEQFRRQSATTEVIVEEEVDY